MPFTTLRRALHSLARLDEKLDLNRREFKALKEQLEAQAADVKALRKQLEAQAGDLKSIARTQEQLALQHADTRGLARQLSRDQKLRSKWETGTAWQINALVRRLFLPDDVPLPFRLAARRFKLRSQHEEDGYLLAILEEAGTSDRRFVEIGCGRSGGNAAVLAFELGWSGLMVDANPAAIEYVTKIYAFNETVRGVVAMVSADNINTLLESHGYAGEVDLLSLDIDSYDYWVFEALEVCSPRVLMLEYNAGFGPTRSVTIPRDAVLADAPKGYSGASLTALTKLAERKGYRLVACEYSGVNAFYLRHDVAPALDAQPVERAYRPQMSRLEPETERASSEEILRRIAEHNLPLQEV